MKMCSAFANLRHDVVLFAGRAKFPVDDVFNYYGVSSRFEIMKNYYPRIRGLGGTVYGLQTRHSLLQIEPPHVLYGRDMYSLFFLRNSGLPLIYESHKPPSNFIRRWMELKLIQCSNFKRLVVISNVLRNMYLEIFDSLSQERVMVARDAANDEMQTNVEAITLPGRDGSVKAAYVGSLCRGRGIELIVEVTKRVPEVDFHIIGGTASEEKKYKSMTNSWNIHFHGFVPPGSLSAYFAASDILLAPYENKVAVGGGKGDTSKWMSPLKIFEYMSWGKAIVTSDLPVLREVLVHNENCLMCHPGDVEGWAKAIKNLADDKNCRIALGRHARQQFLERYTWEQRAKRVLGGL